MPNARKNSIHKRFLRRPSTGGKTGKGSMAMMGGGSNTMVKSDGHDTPAVAVDHQHYYRHHHATAEPGSSSLAGLGSHETPPSSKYRIPFSFTQTGPPKKATGIRRPGPRNQIAAPRVADHGQKQTDHSPRSSRRTSSGTEHREQQQSERSSPGGIQRRSPREASPPNFSRKTTPSPQQGRSRSNSKTNDVPATVCEAAAAAEEDQNPLDGGFILLAKTYQPPDPNNITIISDIQPQQSHFSPSSTESESESESGPRTGDSAWTAPTSTHTEATCPSPVTMPSSTPVEAHPGSPCSRKGSSSSGTSSSGHVTRRPPPKTPTGSLLDKVLPTLPATVYEPPSCEETDTNTKAHNKPRAACNREPSPGKQDPQRNKRPVNSPLPPKRPLSPAQGAAPPLPAIPNHSKQEAKASSAAGAVTACDAKAVVEPKKKQSLFLRRQNKTSSKDSTTSSSTAILAEDCAASVRTTKAKVNNSKPPSISINANAQGVGLQPLNTQRAKKMPVYSRSSQPDQNRHGSSSSSQPVQHQEAATTTTTNKELGMFFTIHPENNIIEEVSPSSVQSRIKQTLKMAANTTKEERNVSTTDLGRVAAHQTGIHEPGAANEADQDEELQKLMQEVDTVFRGLATTTRARRAKTSPSGRVKAGAAPIAAGDVSATCRLLPLSPEEMRRSRRVNPLNLSKELKELQESSRPAAPSPRKDTTNETAARQGDSASSRKTPRRTTPLTPPPSCRSSNQSSLSRPGQDSPSKGGREEGKRFDALKRRDEFLKYEGGVF